MSERARKLVNQSRGVVGAYVDPPAPPRKMTKREHDLENWEERKQHFFEMMRMALNENTKRHYRIRAGQSFLPPSLFAELKEQPGIEVCGKKGNQIKFMDKYQIPPLLLTPPLNDERYQPVLTGDTRFPRITQNWHKIV